MRCPGIIQGGPSDAPFYTNSTHLPVDHTDDPLAALDHQDELQTKYTGGTVLHLYMGEKVSSASACKALVRRSLERFRLPYITITPTVSICPRHGYLAGEHEFCPAATRKNSRKTRREAPHRGVTCHTNMEET